MNLVHTFDPTCIKNIYFMNSLMDSNNNTMFPVEDKIDIT